MEPSKEKGSKHNLDGQDGFKMGLKLNNRSVKFDGGSKQPLNGPFGHLNRPISPVQQGRSVWHANLLEVLLL